MLISRWRARMETKPPACSKRAAADRRG